MKILLLSLVVSLATAVPVDKAAEESEDAAGGVSEETLEPRVSIVESQSELRDDGDGLTGPQPSIVGSVDKVFKQVNKFDQYQCLQVIL